MSERFTPTGAAQTGTITGGPWGSPGTTPQNNTSPWLGQATQYDANGYAIVPQVNNWGTNPYAADAAATNQAVQANSQQGLQNIQSMQNQLNAYGAGDGGYPAMANDYGLGGQAIPGATSNPSYMQTPVSSGGTDTGSRGFNPWSLSGEALSRQ